MPIDSYEVFWDGLNPGSSAFTSLAIVESETLHYTTSNVVAGTNYRFRVSASNLVGDSVASPYLLVKAANRPDAPNKPIAISQD